MRRAGYSTHRAEVQGELRDARGTKNVACARHVEGERQMLVALVVQVPGLWQVYHN